MLVAIDQTNPPAPATLPYAAGEQAAVCAAAIATAFQGAVENLSSRLWLETCSTHEHPPSDRCMVGALLAAVRPGDLVVLPSPCRLARYMTDMENVLARLHSQGVAVLTVAVGSAAAPAGLAVLADGGQLPAGRDAAAMRELIAGFRRATALVAVAAQALSSGHGWYASQHAYMQRVGLTGLPAAHPVRTILECHMLVGRQHGALCADVLRGAARRCAGAGWCGC
jgi:hypothetical protein